MISILVLSALAQGLPAPQRPADPFVFRSVLDQRVRIVTAALDARMWCAWDTTTCGLYKSWKGGVRFEGTVWTNTHGPQPTTKGSEYMRGFDKPVWSAIAIIKDPAAPQPRLEPLECTARWLGHEVYQGRLILNYAIDLKDGRSVRVQERCEFVLPEHIFSAERREELDFHTPQHGLWRQWRVLDCPEDVALQVLVRRDSTGRFFVDEALAQDAIEDVKNEQGVTVETRIMTRMTLGKPFPVGNIYQFWLDTPTKE
jgi:hypothetical protein